MALIKIEKEPVIEVSKHKKAGDIVFKYVVGKVVCVCVGVCECEIYLCKPKSAHVYMFVY